MIDAAETSLVALVFGAHDGAPMAAGIEEAAHLAACIAAKNNRSSGNLAGNEITRFPDFRCVPNINPTLGKDFLHLFPLDVRRDQGLPV